MHHLNYIIIKLYYMMVGPARFKGSSTDAMFTATEKLTGDVMGVAGPAWSLLEI